jgi:hypothetical protein
MNDIFTVIWLMIKNSIINDVGGSRSVLPRDPHLQFLFIWLPIGSIRNAAVFFK